MPPEPSPAHRSIVAALTRVALAGAPFAMALVLAAPAHAAGTAGVDSFAVYPMPDDMPISTQSPLPLVGPDGLLSFLDLVLLAPDPRREALDLVPRQGEE